jgi:hypothetical protein
MTAVGDKIQELSAQRASLLTDRLSWDADAKSLAQHFLPRKSRFLEGGDKTNEGGLRTDVLDGTGIRATRVASAGMHGGMTSPARPWFRLGLQDSELAKHGPVRLWLDDVEKRMRTLFSRSNFYQAIHKLYNEIAVFGTDWMFEHPDVRNGLRFNSLTFGEYVIDIDADERVDTIYRSLDLSAKNIVGMFGYINCSDTVQQAYNLASTKLNRFNVIHAIIPREERNPSSLNAKDMPFASYYYEHGKQEKFLRESGYKSLPGFGVRWDITGQDTYGRSPAMDSIGDVRMLQSVWATYLKAEHKRVDPPTANPQNMSRVNSLPGGTNPVNVAAGVKAIYPLYEVKPDPSGSLLIIQDVRQSIREGMYNDLFKMLALAPTKNMTATEVAERHEEKLLQIGPVLERLHTELFTPLIDRTFEIMIQEDMVSPWPEDISEAVIKVDFISLLAQAQKMVATNAVDQYMGFIGSIAEIWPKALDIPNIDEIGDGYADYLGIQTKMTHSQEERDAMRVERDQAAQAAQSAEVANSASQTAKNMAETPVQGGEGTALDALMSGVV